MDRLKIPSLALLGLALTACEKDDDDPIVGAWDATLIGEVSLPFVDESYTYTVDMEIDADLTGTYTTHASGGGEAEAYPYSLTVEPGDGAMYTIAIKDERTLTCTLSGAKLDCTDEYDTPYVFKKR